MSSSRAIFRASRANKVGLSRELDATLKSSHDMRIFGIGFLAECASPAAYTRALSARMSYYSAMEARFDKASPQSPMGALWPRFAPELRQRPALLQDLDTVGVRGADAASHAPSGALAEYVGAIEAASDNALVGHFYTRYFADLFGGSMIGEPTRLAVALPRECAFYRFPPAVEGARGEYVERVYEGINEVGEKMGEVGRAEAVDEARRAFAHNAALVTEVGLPTAILGAARGAVNIAVGYAARGLAPKPLGTVAARMGREVEGAPSRSEKA